jgi:hypothetical protein
MHSYEIKGNIKIKIIRKSRSNIFYEGRKQFGQVSKAVISAVILKLNRYLKIFT